MTTTPSVSLTHEGQEPAGVCLAATRRFVEIFHPIQNTTYLGVRGERDQDVIPGDFVNFSFNENSSNEEEIIVSSVATRKSLIQRSYGRKTKLLTANSSELWIVSAPPPLFNPLSIDRMLVAASFAGIPVRIIANKEDLEPGFLQSINFYKDVCTHVHSVSAKSGSNIESLISLLNPEEKKLITITGMSGVGKSSLVKRIFNDDEIRVGELSHKTGQGRQTTSAAQGYVYSNKNENQYSILFDLPGIQSFGICHLPQESLSSHMPDIQKYADSCKFRDCSHTEEPECAVLDAISQNLLAPSRLKSYHEMREELNQHYSY